MRRERMGDHLADRPGRGGGRRSRPALPSTPSSYYERDGIEMPRGRHRPRPRPDHRAAEAAEALRELLLAGGAEPVERGGRRDRPGRGGPAALRPRDRRRTMPAEAGDRRARGRLREGLLHRPGAGRAAPLPRASRTGGCVGLRLERPRRDGRRPCGWASARWARSARPASPRPRPDRARRSSGARRSSATGSRSATAISPPRSPSSRSPPSRAAGLRLGSRAWVRFPADGRGGGAEPGRVGRRAGGTGYRRAAGATTSTMTPGRRCRRRSRSRSAMAPS